MILNGTAHRTKQPYTRPAPAAKCTVAETTASFASQVTQLEGLRPLCILYDHEAGRYQRLKLLTTARLEIWRPARPQPTKEAMLQRCVAIDPLDRYLDALDLTRKAQLADIVGKVPRNITNHQAALAVTRPYRHGTGISIIHQVQHQRQFVIWLKPVNPFPCCLNGSARQNDRADS